MKQVIRDVFCDHEYTLIDFGVGHNAAIEKLAKKYDRRFAEFFNLWFTSTLEALRVKDDDWSKVPGEREAFTKMQKRIKTIQFQNVGHIQFPYGDRFLEWSRETAAIWAAQQAGIIMDIHHALEVGSIYWDTIKDESPIYPEVKEFLYKLKKHNIRIHIFSSSDARLLQRNGKCFLYYPTYSREKKIERLQWLKQLDINLGIFAIGDPIDKPHHKFYQYMFKQANRRFGDVKPATSICVGDSFYGDVLAPMDVLGLRCGYHLSRNAEFEDISTPKFTMYQIDSLLDIDLS